MGTNPQRSKSFDTNKKKEFIVDNREYSSSHIRRARRTTVAEILLSKKRNNEYEQSSRNERRAEEARRKRRNKKTKKSTSEFDQRKAASSSRYQQRGDQRNGNRERGRVENNTGGKPKGKGGIPDRWLQYKPIGQAMEGTRFLAFKTPLRPHFFNFKGFVEEQRFEVDTAMTHVNSMGKQLGLVIDLTNTDRYYDGRLWEEHQVQYLKICCPGHEVNGDERFYRRFFNAVSSFFNENWNNDKLVGVHCTHGLNRTGYLICRYLIEQNRWAAQQAINSFGAARGHPMERETYIESLHEAERKMLELNVGGPSNDYN